MPRTRTGGPCRSVATRSSKGRLSARNFSPRTSRPRRHVTIVTSRMAPRPSGTHPPWLTLVRFEPTKHDSINRNDPLTRAVFHSGQRQRRIVTCDRRMLVMNMVRHTAIP